MGNWDDEVAKVVVPVLFIAIVLWLLSGCSPTQAATPSDCGDAPKIAAKIIDIIARACVDGETVPFQYNLVDMALICRPTTPI